MVLELAIIGLILKTNYRCYSFLMNRLYILYLFASAFCLSSCVADIADANPSDSQVEKVSFVIDDFVAEDQTKSALELSTMHFQWSDNDVVGIFPSSGFQAEFLMEDGAGSNVAVFDGGSWGLKAGESYYAYYPFSMDNFESKDKRENVFYSYEGQEASFADEGGIVNLGKYDFMASGESKMENGAVNFRFKHMGALCRLTIKVPKTAVYSKISIEAKDAVIPVSGSYDCTYCNPEGAFAFVCNYSRMSHQFIVNFPHDRQSFTKDEEVRFYFLMPAVDLTDQAPKIVLLDSENNYYEEDIMGKPILSGRSYAWSILKEQNNLTNSMTKEGDTYVVTVANAGSLREIVGDEFHNIADMRIVGNINGSDVLCIRQMANADGTHEADAGVLTALDLSDVNIVEGGNNYYGTHSTTDNEIGNSMFCKTCLEKVILPNSVTSVGELAFWQCVSLSDIHMPVNITTIKPRAFSGCTSLESIEIPEGVNQIPWAAFSDCTSLKNIKLPESLSAWISIDENAFAGCTSLETIDLPENMNAMGEEVFSGCTSLSNIILPQTLVNIPRYAFRDCMSLSAIDIPENVGSIGYCAFEGCTSLNSIIIPDNIEKMEGLAFNGCTSLSSVTLNKTLTVIPEHTFKGCTALEAIAIPENISVIEKGAFYGCSALKSITIPEKVTSLPWDAFYECTSLAEVHLPSRLETLGRYSFYKCTSLNNISLPEYLKKTEWGVFSGCTALTSIVIPESIVEMEGGLFHFCI